MSKHSSHLLRQIALRYQVETYFLRAVFCLLIVCSLFPAFALANAQGRKTAKSKQQVSGQEEAFIEDLHHRVFLYFQDQPNPQTGLVLARARTDGKPHDGNHPSYNMPSSASTGFGLTALC